MNYQPISNLHIATKHTTVQVLRRTLDFNEEIADTAKSIGDAWFRLAQPIIVRDANIVHPFQEIVLSGVQQLVQPLAAALFHSLEDELNVNWHLNSQRLEPFDGMDPT